MSLPFDLQTTQFTDGKLPELLFVGGRDLSVSPLTRPLHQHDSIAELHYIFSGSGTYFHENHSCRIQPGHILLVNAGALHEIAADEGRTLGLYCFGITGLHLDGLPPNHLTDPAYGFVRRLTDETGLFESICQSLSAFITSGRPYAGELCSQLVSSLILLAVNSPAVHQKEVYPANMEIAVRIREYMDVHYTEELSLGAISHALQISPYYASHVFRKMIGYAPIQYIIRRRIGMAQSLLITTEQSVQQIAAAVGYDHTAHFHATFTKMVGLPPSRYRKFMREHHRGALVQ